MFDPNNPISQQPGQMNIMSALGGQPQVPGRPGLQPNQPAQQNDWKGQFKDARMDWRQDRPLNSAFGNPQDFMAALRGWRDDRPQRDDFRNGVVPAVPAAPGAIQPVQQIAPVPGAIAPQGMVGSSYGVQGMTPAANPFGLPTY